MATITCHNQWYENLTGYPGFPHQSNTLVKPAVPIPNPHILKGWPSTEPLCTNESSSAQLKVKLCQRK